MARKAFPRAPAGIAGPFIETPPDPAERERTAAGRP